MSITLTEFLKGQRNILTSKMTNRKEYHKNWYIKNKERVTQRQKEYYQTRKEQKRKKQKEWEKKNPEKRRLYVKRWLENTRPDYFKKYNKQKARENRLKVVEHYGGKCACCGEDKIEFLALDHINGDGQAERKRLKRGGSSFYSYVIKNKYPDRYRLLCHNCNFSLGKYGYCPHQKEGKRTKTGFCLIRREKGFITSP